MSLPPGRPPPPARRTRHRQPARPWPPAGITAGPPPAGRVAVDDLHRHGLPARRPAPSPCPASPSHGRGAVSPDLPDDGPEHRGGRRSGARLRRICTPRAQMPGRLRRLSTPEARPRRARPRMSCSRGIAERAAGTSVGRSRGEVVPVHGALCAPRFPDRPRRYAGLRSGWPRNAPTCFHPSHRGSAEACAAFRHAHAPISAKTARALFPDGVGPCHSKALRREFTS